MEIAVHAVEAFGGEALASIYEWLIKKKYVNSAYLQ